MATEYKIIYSYEKQANTRADRSVAFNRFVASGDVGRNIGQITSITYEHWHTSTRGYEWKLRGRLKLADGTEFVSDEVSHVISGNVVKFTNTFHNLPTAEQFKTLAAVETLNALGSTSSDGYYATLYWHANSDRPIRLIVTFIEEPPVFYAPRVDEFSVTRCNENGVPDDEGSRASVNLRLGIGKQDGLNSAQLRIYYAANAYPDVESSPYIDLTSRIPEFMTGVFDSLNVITGDWAVGSSWYFAAVFIAGGENAVDTHIMPRAMGSLHVAGDTGGICVCGFSNGTKDSPMFESYAPAHFYGGAQFYGNVNGLRTYRSGEVNTGDVWIDGKEIYRYILVVETSLDGDSGVIGNVPSAIGDLVSAHGTIKTSDGTFRPIPFAYYNNLAWNLACYVDADGGINLQIGSNYSGTHKAMIMLEYTKA